MTDDLSTASTVRIATYATRRDAEIARDRLEDENIRVLISADDAGSMHPHLQATQGVKVLVLAPHAQTARTVLAEANLLPEKDPVSSAHGYAYEEDQATAPTSWMHTMGIAAVVFLILMLFFLILMLFFLTL